MAKLSSEYENILRFVAFRKQMGAGLSKIDAKRIFGEEVIDEFSLNSDVFTEEDTEIKDLAIDKVNITIKLGEKLQFLDWVKYIGVSGSVAAGTVKEEDDIDLFIVVKNHRVWLYRGILLLKTKGHSKRVGDKNDKDKLCLNFYAEERGLKNLPKDIFTFHELSYLKTIYGSYDELISNFDWFSKFTEKQVPPPSEGVRGRSLLLWPINIVAMLAQLSYMTLRKHNPNLQRLMKGYKKGYLELFHENDFKEAALRESDRLMSDLVESDTKGSE